MKRKKSLLFCGLGLGFMTMVALGACDSGRPAVEPIPVDELTTQEIFIDSYYRGLHMFCPTYWCLFRDGSLRRRE